MVLSGWLELNHDTFPLQRKPGSSMNRRETCPAGAGQQKKGFDPFPYRGCTHMDRQTRLFAVPLPPIQTAIQQCVEDNMTRVPKKHLDLNFCHLFELFFLQTFASLVYSFPEIPGKHFLDTVGMNFSQRYSTALVNKVLWNTSTPPSTRRARSVSRDTQGNY